MSREISQELGMGRAINSKEKDLMKKPGASLSLGDSEVTKGSERMKVDIPSFPFLRGFIIMFANRIQKMRNKYVAENGETRNDMQWRDNS